MVKQFFIRNKQEKIPKEKSIKKNFDDPENTARRQFKEYS